MVGWYEWIRHSIAATSAGGDVLGLLFKEALSIGIIRKLPQCTVSQYYKELFHHHHFSYRNITFSQHFPLADGSRPAETPQLDMLRAAYSELRTLINQSGHLTL